MGKSDRRIKLTLDVQANLKDLQGQVGEMQKVLGGLKMPDSLTQSTTKSINDLMDRIKKMQDYTAGNEINLVDEKKTQKELDGIRKDFLSLIDKLEAGSSKIKIGDNKATEALRKGIEEYKKAIEDANKEYTKQEKKVRDIKKELDGLGKKTPEEKIKDSANKRVRNLEKERARLKGVEEEYKKKYEGTPQQSQADRYWGMTNDAKEQTKVNKDLVQAKKELTKAQNNYEEAIKKTIQKSEALQNEYDKENQKLDKLKKGLEGINDEQLNKLKQSLKASDISFDFDIDAINNIDELDKKLESLDTQSLEKVKQILSQIIDPAKQGAISVDNLGKEISETREKAEEFNSSLENFKDKAKYFFGIENSINLFKRAVRAAYETVKDLDAVMTETAVVTEFDVGDMWDQLPEYTARANELGVSIHDAYEAATIYYQQGLKTNEVMAVSNETLKMARIAGLDAAEATDRMTNALRGFNMEINENNAQRVNDVYSELAAITASDTDEISVAMTKVASLAHNANMEFETTSAFLAQMIETTRESAETAGTALKTVVARFSEVKELYNQGDLMGTDEEGEEIDVNKVSVALRSAGINLNEYLSGAKGLDDIFIELASKWDSLDIVQQRYIATMAAGSRQQSRFIAMMSDYDRTMQLVSAANNSAGSSQKQYEKTLESLQTKLTKLKNAWDSFLMGIANNDVIKITIDILTKLVSTINKLFEGIDRLSGRNGLVSLLTRVGVGVIGLKIGRSIVKDILSGISPQLGDFVKQGEGIGKSLLKGTESKLKDTKKLFSKNYWKGLTDIDTTDYDDFIKKNQELTKALNEAKMATNLNEEQMLKLNNLEKETAKSTQLITEAEKISNDNAVRSILLKKAKEDATYAEALANGKLTQEQIQEAQAEAAASGIKGKSLIVALASVLSLKKQNAELAALTFQKWLDTKATSGNMFATMALDLIQKKNIITVKGMTLAYIGAAGAVGLLVAAVGLLVYSIVKLVKAIKRDPIKEQLEDAQEAADKTAEAMNSLKDSVSSLEDTLTSLDDQYEALEKMTRGSKEWRDAVRGINTEVLELMSKYDDLKIKNENGVLIITNEEDIYDKEVERYNQAQVVNTYANRRLNAAEINSKFDEYDWVEGTDQKAKEVIDEIAKKLVNGDYVIPDGSNEEWDIRQRVTKDLETRGFKFEDMTDLKISPEMLKDLESYGNELLNYEEKQNENLDALAALGMSGIKLAPGTENAVTNFLNNQTEDAFRYQAETEAEKIREDGDYEGLVDAILEETGYKTQEEYEKIFGEIIDRNDAQSKLTALLIQKYTKDAAEIFSNNFDTLPPVLQKMYTSDTKAAFSNADVEVYEKDQDKYVHDIWESLEPEVQSIYGTESELGVIIYEFMKFSRESWNSVVERLSNFGITRRPDYLGKIDTGHLNIMMDDLQNIYYTKGEKVAEEYANSIFNILDSFDGKENAEELRNNFLLAFDTIDWNKDFNEIKKEFDSMGIKLTDEQLEGLVEQVNDLGIAAKKVNLKTLAEQLNSFGSLSAKIKSGEQGATGWSEEDMNKAIAAGASRDDFFKDYASGTYTYIGENLRELGNKINGYATVTEQERKRLETDIANGEIFNGIKGSSKAETFAQKSDIISKYLANGGTNIDENVFETAFNQKDENVINDLYSILFENAEAVDDNTQALEEYDRYDKESRKVDTNWESVFLNSFQSKNKDIDLNPKLANNEDAGSLKNTALNLGMDKSFIDNANTSELSVLIDVFEKAEELEIDKNKLTDYIKELQGVHKELSLIGVAQLALSNTRTNRGMEQLVESYEDWSKLIDEDGNLLENLDSKSSEVLTSMKKSANDLLDTQEDLSDEFWEDEKNVKLFKKAVEEGGQALVDLRIAAADDYLVQFNVPESAKDEIDALYSYIMEATPTMEIGTSMDVEPIMNAFNAILESGAMTAAQIQEFFGALGVEFDVIYKQVPLIKNIGGVDRQVGFQDSDVIDCIIPHYKGGVKPSTTYSSKNKGGGSGGGGSEKNDSWENPYDELYNLQEKINEALRTREALERKYQKLLKKTSSTVGEVSKAYYDQIRQLRTEADLQYEMQAGRARQLNNVGNEYYTDDEGNRSTFSSLGVTKYGSYNQQTGLLQIDWSGLEALENDPSKVNEGKAAEAYISRLEELQDQFEEVRDELWDIEDQIEELREEAIENYLTFEDRVMEALVNSYQTEIDNYSALNDAITSATDDIIRGIQDEINLSRQIRDNTQKEEDIADKEARLAYLRRDTSGANAMEIKKLEEELNNDRQSYSDTMIDQQIAEMQNDATLASEQRQHQIEIMQNQLEVAKQNGTLWGEVWNLLNTATAGDGTFSQNSELVTLLEEAEAFQSLSRVGQAKWWEEAATAFKEARVGLDEAEDKYKVDANNDGKITSSGTSSTVSSISNMTGSGAGSGSTTGTGAQTTTGAQTGNGYFSKVGSYEKPKAQMPAAEVKYLQQALNAAGFTDANGKAVNVDGVYGPKTMAAVKKLQTAIGVTVDGYFGTKTRAATMNSKYKAYETGGLNDTTGPAWLDGTKTKPELVLNWKDTQNFIALKDILANLMGGQGGAINGGGDNYYDINISAELGSDYDVDKLAERIKKRIYDDSSYRNVNAINFTR